MNDSSVWVVLCNCPDETVADQLARGLIEARLAACVNRLAAVQSRYRWNDRIETANEVPLLIKTTAACYAEVQTWLLAHHPYDVPEIIAWPLASGSPGYLAWVAQEVQRP